MRQIQSSASSLRLALGGLIALAAAMGIGRFVYTPILPAMMRDLDLSASEAGYLASANFLGYLLGALLASSPRFGGGRNGLVLALVASAATTALSGVFSGLWTLAAVRFAGGVASACTLVFASALVLQRLVAAGRSALTAVHFAGVGTGIALSALIVNAATLSGAGWRGLWGWSALAAALAVPAVLLLIPPAPAGAAGQGAAARLVPNATFLRLITAYGLFGFGYVITATFLVALVRAEPALAAIEPWVWLVFGLAAAPSVWLWTTAARRWGTAPVFKLACLVEAAGVAVSVAGLGIPGVILAAVLLGGTFMGLTALGIAAGRASAGAAGQQAVGLFTAAFGLGQIVGPAVAGVLRDGSGSFALPTCLAAAVLVVAALVTPRRL